jgi:hypothetical protein
MRLVKPPFGLLEEGVVRFRDREIFLGAILPEHELGVQTMTGRFPSAACRGRDPEFMPAVWANRSSAPRWAGVWIESESA